MDVNQLLEQLNDSQACSKQMHEQYTNATRLFHTTQTKVVEVANCLLEKLQDMNVDVREHYKHVDGSDGYNKRTSGFRSLESFHAGHFENKYQQYDTKRIMTIQAIGPDWHSRHRRGGSAESVPA